jgi:beta-galactosidase
VPSPALAADLVRWAVPTPVADGLAAARALPVTVSSGSLPDGRRAWFVFNWSWNDTSLTLDRDVTDAVTADAHASGTELPLGAWSTLTLLDG